MKVFNEEHVLVRPSDKSASFAEDDPLPCEVMIAPATILSRGVSFGTLVSALQLRQRLIDEDQLTSEDLQINAPRRPIPVIGIDETFEAIKAKADRAKYTAQVVDSIRSVVTIGSFSAVCCFFAAALVYH